jgi:hypothetical protein
MLRVPVGPRVKQPPAGPGLPPLPTDAQLQAQAGTMAQAQFDPVLKQIADSINRRGAEGAQAITALTGQYASQLGRQAAALPGIYAPAKAETAAATQALADRISGVGAAAGQDLAGMLRQAGQAGPGDINLGQIGQGAGTAAYGTGIAGLDALIARQAAAQTELSQEPGFAYGAGLQELGGLQRDLTRELADQQGQVAAQVPGLTQSIYDTLLGRRETQQAERERVREFGIEAAAQKARDKAAAQADAADRRERIRQFNQTRLDQGTKDALARADEVTQRKVNAILATGVDPKTGVLLPAAGRQIARILGVPAYGGTSQDAFAAGAKAEAAATKEQHRHEEALQKITVSQGTLTERIRSAKARERNQRLSVEERERARRDRVRFEIEQGKLERRKAKETRRHNKATEASRTQAGQTSGLVP